MRSNYTNQGYMLLEKLLLLANGDLAICAAHKKVPCLLILNSEKEYKCELVLERYKHWINAIVNLSDYRFASGSFDKTIKIWDSKPNYSCIHTI
jgi:hypothetical protein